jgi:hypothetical protein
LIGCRGKGERPGEDAITTFFAIEAAGRRFLLAAEHFFPYLAPWVLLDELDWPSVPWHWHEFQRVRRRLASGLQNALTMDERAAKSFLFALSGMINGGTRRILP